MTDAAPARGSRSRERWGDIVTGVSAVGSVLASLSVLLLGLIAYVFASELNGSPPSWWFWPAVFGVAAAGIFGVTLTSATPRLAYLLRLAGLFPLLALGLASPWLMAPVVVMGAAHLSLLLDTWRHGRRTVLRLAVAVVVSAVLVLLIVPLDKTLECENPGDPAETCGATYGSAVGWGGYEDDNRNLAGWIAVVLLGGLIVAVPRGTGFSSA